MTNQFKHIFFTLLLPAAAILLLFTAQAFAAEDTLLPASPHSMDADVSYGFSDSGKQGSYLPVTISIDGQYAGTEGTAALYYYTEETGQYCMEESFLVSEEGCQVTLYLPVFTESLPVRVTLQVENRTVFAEEHTVTSPDFYEMTIGVVTSNPGSYANWNTMLINEAYQIYSDLIFLPPEELPLNPFDLNMVDILIIDDTSDLLLTHAQIQSIEQWLSESSCLRHLVLSRPNTQLLARLEGLITVSAEEDFLLNNLTEQTDPAYIFEELLGVFCTEYRIPDASVLVEDNGHPLIQQIPYHAGTITVTGYALSQVSDAFATYAMVFRSFWNTLLDEEDFSRAVQSHYFFDSYEESQGTLLAGQNQLQYVSRVGVYIIILLLYVAVCIPLIFYFTRRNKKRTYLRLLLTVNALLFTLFIIFTAIPTRHDKVFLSSICLDEYTDTGLKRFSCNSIQSPYGDSFTLHLDPSCRILPALWGQAASPEFTNGILFQKQSFDISRNDTDTSLIFSNQIPFQPNYFQLEQSLEVTASPVRAQISFFDGRLSGTITNCLDYDLEDVVLLIQGWIIPINTLEQGSTIDLADYDKYLFHSNSFSNLMGTLLLDNDTYQQQSIHQEQTAHIYELILNRLMTSSPSQGILLGCSKEVQNPFAEYNVSFDSCITQLTAVHLDVNMTQTNLHYMPALQMLPDLLEGEYDWYNRELLTEEASLSYGFYQNMDLVSLELVYSTLPEGLAWEYEKPELIYAYNWDMGKYIPLSSDSLTQPELSSYLKDNRLFLYYVGSSDTKVLLPDISVIWKETGGNN